MQTGREMAGGKKKKFNNRFSQFCERAYKPTLREGGGVEIKPGIMTFREVKFIPIYFVVDFNWTVIVSNKLKRYPLGCWEIKDI